MTSIHIHLNSHAACMQHGGPGRSPADKNLRQEIAALLVLAMLEQILKAATQGHHGANHGASHNAGAPANGASASPVDAANGPQGGSADATKQGVLQPFLELLLLLALLLRQGGKAGNHPHHANDTASKVADGLGQGGNTPQGLAQAPEAESNSVDDAVSMMVSAMREGRADSLMAGQDDAGFERELQQMSTGLRESLAPAPEEGIDDAGNGDQKVDQPA